MVLNFCFEFAAFIIGIILCLVSVSQYKMTDLKGKIYVNIVRVMTVMAGCNMIAYSIIHRNYISLSGIAEVIVCLSFVMMVSFVIGLNFYLITLSKSINYISQKSYMTIGFPFILLMLVIILNCMNHCLFDLAFVEENLQIVFHSWYKAPYILTGLSLIMYIIILVKNCEVYIEKKRTVLFWIPVFVILIYFLQYRFKSVAIIGFGNMMVLLLLYFYSFHRSIKRDSLTRLPDGSSFKRMLDYRFGRKESMVVVMITLDDFKQVNREFGYQNGNKFLQVIANYLEKEAPKYCIARYSGDKFAVVFDNQSCEQVLNWCDSILHRFESNWVIGKIQHKLSTCISVLEIPLMADTSEQVLDLLEQMNAYGKQNKRNQCVVCNDSFKKKMHRRLRIASILHDVVQDRKMHVEYQPILDVQENMFSRGEALFRMIDDELGNVPPNEFFPIAEENGYIVEVGYILLEKVCQYIKSFDSLDKQRPIISVNFSRQQVMDENVDRKVQEILDKYSIEPSNLAFEIPESIFAIQFEEVQKQLMKLSAIGCRLYLDGFGNAILDLPKFLEIPFEIIKINKAALKGAEHDEAVYLLVSAIAAVLEENGKKILGDGIDSERMKGMADSLFMDFMEGHFFCEPMHGDYAKDFFGENGPELEILCPEELDAYLDLESE